MAIAGIYKIESPSGSIYIGQSVNIKRRWGYYKGMNFKYSDTAIVSSIKKYGPEKHIFSIVQELPSDISSEVMTRMETSVIEIYELAGFKMLNIIRPGEFKSERRALISERKRGNKKGVKHSEQSKEKMRLAQKNRVPASEETKNKIRKTLTGRKRSTEVGQKIAVTQTGRKFSDETKNKMSKAQTERQSSPEYRKIVSQRVKAFWNNKKKLS